MNFIALQCWSLELHTVYTVGSTEFVAHTMHAYRVKPDQSICRYDVPNSRSEDASMVFVNNVSHPMQTVQQQKAALKQCLPNSVFKGS